jgi:hypothetical protein
MNNVSLCFLLHNFLTWSWMYLFFIERHIIGDVILHTTRVNGTGKTFCLCINGFEERGMMLE